MRNITVLCNSIKLMPLLVWYLKIRFDLQRQTLYTFTSMLHMQIWQSMVHSDCISSKVYSPFKSDYMP